MSELLNFIKEGQLFIIPILIIIITQILKIVLELLQKKRVKLNDLGHYGGMPSSHTALFVSLATIIALDQGLYSPVFAISVIVCGIMIRDALGMRHHLENHGDILKQLIKEHEEYDHTKIKHDKIVTSLGHTPSQVIVGAILGLLMTLLMHYLFSLI